MTTAPIGPADVNWCNVLAHHARRTPDKILTLFEGDATTYGEMAGQVAALAGGLAARGVGPGDVVAILSYNRPEFLEALFAANHLGAIAMPINWRLAAPEVRYILDHSGARALVCDEALLTLAEEATAGLSGSLVRVSMAPVDTPDWTSLADLRDRSQGVNPVAASGDDVHRLMYTSGTTGRPKGVMLTHANLAWKNLAHIVEFGFTSADLGLACGPLYHVGALDLTTTSLIAAGATTILHRSFDADAVVDEIERSRVTAVWLAPAMVNAIMALPDIDQRDLSSIRVVINGGEKMPIPLIERIQRVFPSAWFADAYGMTETVSGDTFLDRGSIITKLGSVGRPCLYLELDLWDEDGRPVPAGEQGEIVMRGPKVFKGYWRDPEATSAAFTGELVPHGRHRRPRRGRLPLHCRSPEGHDRLGRREHRQLGNRARPLRARRGPRSGRRRSPRSPLGRGARGLRGPATGSRRHPRRAHCALRHAAGAVQGPQRDHVRRGPATEPFGESPETRAPGPVSTTAGQRDDAARSNGEHAAFTDPYGGKGWPFGLPTTDFAALGYRADEYVVEGEAVRYGPAAGTELGRNGRWQIEPVGSTPYETRMVVMRPVDPTAFNGTVVVLWNNVSAGYENFTGGDSPEVFESGFAYVAASVQRVGVHGQPDNPQGLRDWDPERYGSLSIPSDDYSFDIYTQVADLVAPDRPRDDLDPMGGLDVRRVVAQGASQSAARLASYLDGVQPLTQRFDAFYLVMYFGGGTPLEVGDEVMTVREAAADASQPRIPEGLHLLRDDLGVLVMVVNTECEATSCYPVRQPDSDRFRYWEVAGASHVSLPAIASSSSRMERDFGFAIPLDGEAMQAVNQVSVAPVVDAALHHLQAWLLDGTPPPVQPRIAFAGEPPAIVRDDHDIAEGGIRLPQVEVPLGHNSALQQSPDIFARLVGYHEAFPDEKVRALYASRDEYLAQYAEATRTAVAASVILPRDVEPLLAEAEQAWPL